MKAGPRWCVFETLAWHYLLHQVIERPLKEKSSSGMNGREGDTGRAVAPKGKNRENVRERDKRTGRFKLNLLFKW